MQIAISGIYHQGKITLYELPPNDEEQEVMVVFLPNNANKKISNRKKQMGILSAFKADPMFYEPLDKKELDKW